MEIPCEGFRGMILYDFKEGQTAEKIVYNCFSKFRHGHAFVSDESREVQPKSVVIPKNIDAVHKMIEEDRHVMYREIEASLGISQAAIYSILHEHLAVKKINSRLILHNLRDSKRGLSKLV